MCPSIADPLVCQMNSSWSQIRPLESTALTSEPYTGLLDNAGKPVVTKAALHYDPPPTLQNCQRFATCSVAFALTSSNHSMTLRAPRICYRVHFVMAGSVAVAFSTSRSSTPLISTLGSPRFFKFSPLPYLL